MTNAGPPTQKMPPLGFGQYEGTCCGFWEMTNVAIIFTHVMLFIMARVESLKR